MIQIKVENTLEVPSLLELNLISITPKDCRTLPRLMDKRVDSPYPHPLWILFSFGGFGGLFLEKRQTILVKQISKVPYPFSPNLICFSLVRGIDPAALCDPRMWNVVFSSLWGLGMRLHPDPLGGSSVLITSWSLFLQLFASHLQDNSFSHIINLSVNFLFL